MDKARLILAAQIRGRRRQLGFKNQDSFAEHCKVSPDTIKKIETGAMWPGPVILEKIAMGLGASVGDLLTEIPNTPKAPLSFHSVLDAYRAIPEDVAMDLSKFTYDSPVWNLVRIAIRSQRGILSGDENHTAKG